MKRKFTINLFCFLTILLVYFEKTNAQTEITVWNFNSNPADISSATGSLTPSLGSGTITNIGGTVQTFASGTSGTGSSDPATVDNTGFALSTFPAVSAANNTAGFLFKVSTFGFKNIKLKFDHRHSNTANKYLQLQYTLNALDSLPTWVNFVADSAFVGDAWNKRSYDFSLITGLNNNTKAGFRVVSTFKPNNLVYSATTAASTYATTGTWRIDMLTVLGTSNALNDTTKPKATKYTTLTDSTSFIVFNEKMNKISAETIANYTITPSLTIKSLTLNSKMDTVLIKHANLMNGINYDFIVKKVKDSTGNLLDSTNFKALYNSTSSGLIITEIIHSPNTVELIEVFNASGSNINLNGLRFTDGTGGLFPNVILKPDSVILFSTTPITANQILGGTYNLITAGLGSTNDILVIRNTLNKVIDSVNYFVGTNGWPDAIAGIYAYSFELKNKSLDNNIGANWTVPVNKVTPTPSVGEVRATAGKYPAPIIITTLAQVSFVGSQLNATEADGIVQIVAKLSNGKNKPTAVNLSVFAASTANTADFSFVQGTKFEWDSLNNAGNDTLKIQITNDAIAENTEYLIFSLTGAKNATLLDSGSNYFMLYIGDNDKLAIVEKKGVELEYVSSIGNGAAGTNSAEIVDYDINSKRLFIANSVANKLDIVSFSNPALPVLLKSVSLAGYGNVNSLAVSNGIVALAMENAIPTSNGSVVIMDVDGVFSKQVTVGAMPDMIMFNQAENTILTANEGQPNADYSIDPEGSVSIIDISAGVIYLTQSNVTTVGFSNYNSQVATLKNKGVRIFGLNATVGKDMEPEYITVLKNDSFAYITCQENNAVAVLNLITKTITDIWPLGTKDFSLPQNALDANDASTTIALANWPIKGLYMPDAIASFKIANKNYLITANEGDAREYTAYNEVQRIGSSTYKLDPTKFPNSNYLKQAIGRLNVTVASGDTDLDGDFDEIHTYGSRSISIWDASNGNLVWDGGNDMEWLIAKHPIYAPIFNASNSNNTFKNRSDDKGPEPEGITTAVINKRTYAFVALERIGGCLVYDVTNPLAPVIMDYKNSRTLAAFGGDNGAEGIIYIPAAESPNNTNYVILANEVSSTLSVYKVKDNTPNNTKTINDAKNAMTCFPIPTLNLLNINLDPSVSLINANLNIVDINGRVILTKSCNTYATTIQTENLISGIYFVVFTNNENTLVTKISK